MNKKNKYLDHARPYLLLMRVDRPVGTFLLLWPCFWALWAASGGIPEIKHLAIFSLGVFLMRSAGCVINDISDAKYDVHVKRTAQRPLAQKLLSTQQAWLLFIGLMLLAMLLLLVLKPLTIKLALIAAFFAISYPLMKRLTYLPQVYLGIAFAWSIPMAFAEISDTVPKIAWLLFVANILWTTAYDTIYAMVDRKDDLKIGVKSTAILFGDIDKIAIGIIQLLFLLAMLLFGQQSEFSWPYYSSLGFAFLLMLYQQYLIRNRDENQCFKAFLNNNWVGFVLFLGVLTDYLLKSP